MRKLTKKGFSHSKQKRSLCQSEVSRTTSVYRKPVTGLSLIVRFSSQGEFDRQRQPKDTMLDFGSTQVASGVINEITFRVTPSPGQAPSL